MKLETVKASLYNYKFIAILDSVKAFIMLLYVGHGTGCSL